MHEPDYAIVQLASLFFTLGLCVGAGAVGLILGGGIDEAPRSSPRPGDPMLETDDLVEVVIGVDRSGKQRPPFKYEFSDTYHVQAVLYIKDVKYYTLSREKNSIQDDWEWFLPFQLKRLLPESPE